MKSTDTRFWAIDKVILGYFLLTGLVVLGWWKNLPQAPGLLVWHVLGSALIVFEVKCPNPTSWLFRNWYPLPYVGYFYKEMAFLIPAVRQDDISRQYSDRWLADLDFRIWGANPCVWLERIQWPALIEWEQLLYTLFLPAVILVALLLWRKGRFVEFQYYAFLIALGYLVSYVGYILVPARGPRYLLNTSATHAIARAVVIPQHAGWARQAGIVPLRLLSQRPYRADSIGLLGQPGSIEAVVQDLFGLHSVPHFCYSLSSIPLHG